MQRWQDELGALQSGAAWFEPWRDDGEQVALSLAGGLPLHDALNLRATTALRFAPADDLLPGLAYEQYIFETGRCPTRDGLHDFFNGLVWLKFPLAKQQLNRVQAAQIEAHGVRGTRGPVRDAATLFDENGALLDAPEALWDALLARDWRRLFVDLRPLWAQARVLVFGHALLEKLMRPRKDLTAHLWRSPCAIGCHSELDRWLAGQLAPGRLADKPFAPLPLLGIPGWWAGNQNFSFYDDSLVFRPAGQRAAAGP